MDEIEKTLERDRESKDDRCETCYSLMKVEHKVLGNREWLTFRCSNQDCKEYNVIKRKVPV
jgi:hypothetical protein